MRLGRIGFLMWVLLFQSGCTLDDARQLGYGAVQNLRQQQCQKVMADDCETRPSYDDYQRERQQIRQAPK